MNGFSKLTREEKLDFISAGLSSKTNFINDLNSHFHSNPEYQQLYQELSENVLSNFFLPYAVAPNFLINDRFYTVPMVTEESSVVAAASSAAKFWALRGGFHAKVISTIKTGHVHFLWKKNNEVLKRFFTTIKESLESSANNHFPNMKKRGGGVISIVLTDKTSEIPDYHQLEVKFQTCGSMGANYINSVLEHIAGEFERSIINTFSETNDMEIIMSILSNFAPENLVEVYTECDLNQIDSGIEGMSHNDFARRFKLALEIASNDIYRAVTHNKGIYNGIDAVVIATGNDFRAVEAQGHAFASVNGKYSSLSFLEADKKTFHFGLRIPLSIGTVGGLTNLHPLAKRSLELLVNPSSEELMQIIASVGLATNYSAIKMLITKGIQEGHMRMHLINILRHFKATNEEIKGAVEYFKNKKVTHQSVENFLKRPYKKELRD